MATIASNPVFPSNPAPKGTAPGNGASGDQADASSAPSDFMQLVSGMIEGNTPENQLPSNLMQLLLTGDTAGLEGLDGLETTDATDSDTSDSDDDGSDEAGALALSALLAGLQSALPAPVAGTSEGGNQGIDSIELNSSQKMMQALLDTSQGALATALDTAAADGAGDGFGADGTGSAGSNGAVGGASQTGASHLQSLMQAHRAAESAPLGASAEVRTPVGAAGWSDEIGTHLAIMAANGRESASLRLSPEHLGPLEVQISVKDGQASVVFGASNPETRSALEQSLPRLREMFASQGLMLGDANVSRDAPRDAFRQQAPAGSTRGSSDASSERDVNPITLRRLGLVDTYV